MRYRRRTIPNFEEYKINENGVIFDNKNRVVKTFINPCNYVSVVLNGKILTVAYLMAKTWLNNDNNDLLVGYKDGNYNNLNVDNLYWYFHQPCKMEDTILMVDMDGEIVDKFEDGEEAAEELNLKINTVEHKCSFNNHILIDDCFLFFERDYNEEQLNIRLNKLAQIKQEKKQKRFKRTDKLQ